jgi:hypothetical protein
MKRLGALLLRFFAGLGTMLLVSVPGTCVCAFAINLISQIYHPNPHDIFSPGAPYAFIAAIVLGLAGLAWFSVRRCDLMPFWGGLSVVAAECALLYYALRGQGELDQYVGIGLLLLASVLGAFVLGVAVSRIFRQPPKRSREPLTPHQGWWLAVVGLVISVLCALPIQIIPDTGTRGTSDIWVVMVFLYIGGLVGPVVMVVGLSMAAVSALTKQTR